MINNKNLHDMQLKLLEKYDEWIKLDCLKPFFKNPAEFYCPVYSNPYFCGIPEDWFGNKPRVMICGEEGAGRWNKDEYKQLTYDRIEELQVENLKYVQGTRNYNINGNEVDENFRTNRSQFWKRFKQIQYLDKNISLNNIDEAMTQVAVIWNNADKLCRYSDGNGNVSSHAFLNGEERRWLHKNGEMDILIEEIRILKPTHIVFLGWHYNSLRINYKREKSIFPDYFNDDKKHSSKYNYPLCKTTMTIDDNNIKVYYLYHPNYGRNFCREGKNDYNEDISIVIEDIKNDLSK